MPKESNKAFTFSEKTFLWECHYFFEDCKSLTTKPMAVKNCKKRPGFGFAAVKRSLALKNGKKNHSLLCLVTFLLFQALKNDQKP
jgi:hypothetical protein